MKANPIDIPTDSRARVVSRFWSKVDRGDGSGCWRWQASKNSKGYGRFYASASLPRVSAHRFALALATEDDRPDLQALHSCHNPSCCNPAHLRWGTNAENQQDSVRAGTSAGKRNLMAYHRACAAGEVEDQRGRPRTNDAAYSAETARRLGAGEPLEDVSRELGMPPRAVMSAVRRAAKARGEAAPQVRSKYKSRPGRGSRAFTDEQADLMWAAHHFGDVAVVDLCDAFELGWSQVGKAISAAENRHG